MRPHNTFIAIQGLLHEYRPILQLPVIDHIAKKLMCHQVIPSLKITERASRGNALSPPLIIDVTSRDHRGRIGEFPKGVGGHKKKQKNTLHLPQNKCTPLKLSMAIVLNK